MPGQHFPTDARGRRGMTALENPALRELALKVLAHHAGSAPGTEALVAAVRRAYDDLARVSVPVIGQIGVDALTGRALHLAKQAHPWLVRTREPEQWKGPLDQMVFCLEQQDPAIATQGAAAVFSTLTGLIVSFIGERLAVGLLRQAWPDAFDDARTEET
jgi:hypothetical protein